MESRVFPTRYILLHRKCVAYEHCSCAMECTIFILSMHTMPCNVFCLLNMHMQCVYMCLTVNCGFCLIGRGRPKQHYIIMSTKTKTEYTHNYRKIKQATMVSGNIYYNMKPDY